MKPELVELLCCPDCAGKLAMEVSERDGEAILEGKLACGCGKVWPVVRGIPRFVPDDAYVGSFSYQWNVHARTQFDDVSGGESRPTFVEKTGFREEDVRGKRVLDVGCGSGRFMDVVRRMGGVCIGVDLSLAVEACYRNLGRIPGMHVVQADVLRLPFAPATFDLAYSIGVLHHTPDTKKAFLELPPRVRPGGRVAVWLYDSYAAGQKINDFWRKITTRLPIRLLYWLCIYAVPIYYLKRIPLFGRFLHILVPSSEHPNWRWRWLDTFDWLSPKYQWKHRYPEVWNWFREAGLEVTEILEPPVAVQGRRPERG